MKYYNMQGYAKEIPKEKESYSCLVGEQPEDRMCNFGKKTKLKKMYEKSIPLMGRGFYFSEIRELEKAFGGIRKIKQRKNYEEKRESDVCNPKRIYDSANLGQLELKLIEPCVIPSNSNDMESIEPKVREYALKNGFDFYKFATGWGRIPLGILRHYTTKQMTDYTVIIINYYKKKLPSGEEILKSERGGQEREHEEERCRYTQQVILGNIRRSQLEKIEEERRIQEDKDNFIDRQNHPHLYNYTLSLPELEYE